MGTVKETMLLAMLLFSFFSPASFSPVSKNLVSVNKPDENIGDHNGTYKNGSVIGGGGRMVNEGKYATTVRAVRGGGGGGAMIPVYAAGQNRIHTGAAPCRKGGLLVLIATRQHIFYCISLYKMQENWSNDIKDGLSVEHDQVGVWPNGINGFDTSSLFSDIIGPVY